MTSTDPRVRTYVASFKKWESLFAEALTGTVTIDTYTLIPPQETTSFGTILANARHAYEQGWVEPTLFPKGTTLRVFRIKRDKSRNLVILYNPLADRTRLRELVALKNRTVELDAQGKIIKINQKHRPNGEIRLDAGNPSCRVVLEDIRKSRLNTLDTIILIKGDLSHHLKDFPDISWENLGYGYGRLI